MAFLPSDCYFKRAANNIGNIKDSSFIAVGRVHKSNYGELLVLSFNWRNQLGNDLFYFDIIVVNTEAGR